jgi:hypothetical protein
MQRAASRLQHREQQAGDGDHHGDSKTDLLPYPQEALTSILAGISRAPDAEVFGLPA